MSIQKASQDYIAQAIETKFISPGNVRGSRVKAVADNGGSVTLGWNHAIDPIENHRAGALALSEKLGWNGKLIGGVLRSSRVSYSWVWVFLERKKIKNLGVVKEFEKPLSHGKGKK